MSIGPEDFILYEFGSKKVCPAPDLLGVWHILHWHTRLVERLRSLPSYAEVAGRHDHMVDNLDTLIFGLREALFETMVLREQITGYRTKEDADGC